MVYCRRKKTSKPCHVWFGTILGDDNKAIKTRDGQPVKLIDLLEEAIRRAADMVRQKNANLSDEEVQRRAKVIGLGAVKYADLSQDRTLDYVFSWDKMLAMQGNTAPLFAICGCPDFEYLSKVKPRPQSAYSISETPTD